MKYLDGNIKLIHIFESFESFFIHCDPNRLDKLVSAIILKEFSFHIKLKY